MSKNKDSYLKLISVAGVGMFLSTLDSGIINIAIPSLSKTFNTNIDTVTWTITLYTLFLSASILLFGKLADRVGRLKIYGVGLALFAISSLLCGAANNITLLILFRAIQGLSAAMLQATSIALITTRTSGKNTKAAMALLGMIIGLGPMMGPVLGGVILSSIGWRWIFWINIPICIFGIYGCFSLNSVKEDLHFKKINYINLILLAAALFSILITLHSINNQNNSYLSGLLITAVLFCFYFFMDIKSKSPVIPLKIFKSLNFTAPIIAIMAFGGATAVAFYLPPLYFEKIRSLPTWQVGLISLSAPAGIVIASRFSNKFVSKLGTTNCMIIGLILMIIGFLFLTYIKVSWPIYIIIILLFIYGVGGGLFQSPCYLNLTAQFSADKQGFISSLIRMLQNIAIAFEAAGAATIISIESKHKSGLLTGIQNSWILSTIILVLALVILLLNKFCKFKKQGLL